MMEKLLINLVDEIINLPDEGSSDEAAVLNRLIDDLPEPKKQELAELSISYPELRAKRIVILRQLGFTSQEVFWYKMCSLPSLKRDILMRALLLAQGDPGDYTFYSLQAREYGLFGDLSLQELKDQYYARNRS